MRVVGGMRRAAPSIHFDIAELRIAPSRPARDARAAHPFCWNADRLGTRCWRKLREFTPPVPRQLGRNNRAAGPTLLEAQLRAYASDSFGRTARRWGNVEKSDQRAAEAQAAPAPTGGSASCSGRKKQLALAAIGAKEGTRLGDVEQNRSPERTSVEGRCERSRPHVGAGERKTDDA